MILKKNKYIKHFIALIILASCSTTSENMLVNSSTSEERSLRNFQGIFDYESFALDDLESFQRIIDSEVLNQEQLRDTKLLINNYKKILSKKKYTLELKPDQQYSKELIELIYKFGLPIQISWNEKNKNSISENLLTNKIDGFCSSLYDDAIASINKEITRDSDSILVIYSKEYASFINALKLNDSNLIAIEYNSTNYQEFSAKVLGIDFSEKRFKKISDLNPNQNIKFNPRPRTDLNQVIILLKPQEYKSMIPALRYHGGSNFKYINFISSMEDITDSKQLLDYEYSWVPFSRNLTSKVKNDSGATLERFLELGALNEWLLIQILDQSGVQSAKINGVTGSLVFRLNSCTKRIIPLQKISADLFSS